MAVELRNIKFVQEIKKYPCLYNYKEADYMRKDTTEAAWTEIGRKFRLSGPAAKEKWKNLRSVFVRHLRPGKNGYYRKKPYYLGEYMQFAVPFIKRPSIIPASFKDPNRTLSIDDDSIEPPTPESQIPTPSQLPSAQRKEPDETQARSVGDKSSNVKVSDNGSSSEDCSKMFLLSLLSDMNQMNNGQIRLFKRKVLGLIDSIMEESTPAPVKQQQQRGSIVTRQECKEEAEEIFDEDSNDSDPLLL